MYFMYGYMYTFKSKMMYYIDYSKSSYSLQYSISYNDLLYSTPICIQFDIDYVYLYKICCLFRINFMLI